MGIQLGSNFTMNAALPLDDRTQVADLSERDAILAGKRYEGLLVYVITSQKNYQLVGGISNANWTELSGSGGGVDPNTGTGKILLVNNSANTINEIGDYLANCPGMIIEYYIFRRTDTQQRRMRGVIRLETQPDEIISADRWSLLETLRSEFGGDSGVSFSLTEVDTEKSVLVITLDDLTGDAHECKFFFKITKFSNDTGKIIILDNNSINPISAIGEYLADAGAVLVDYFCYRKTDAGYKKLRGKLLLEGNPDALTNPDKWSLIELERSEGAVDSGISFSLDPVDTEKSILVITLDNMAGGDHRCDFYFNKIVYSN